MELFRKTPVIHHILKDGTNVFFKLENLQCSGSFKDRGISHMIQSLVKQGPVSKLICSSGGNAGHAVAVAGKKLKIPVEVFVPSTTLPMMIDKLKEADATVYVAGKNWNEADQQARLALAAEAQSLYIPPFDHPLIWEGHTSLITELAEQLTSPPDVIIASVGGGGLLRGIQLGIQSVGWAGQTKILAVETEGAASFAAAKQAGHVVALEKIDTIATTLGALQVTASVLDPTVDTVPVVVTDRQAVSAALKYAQDHRQLVEPSCGASLAVLFDDELRHLHLKDAKNIVVVVCGGSAVSLDLLAQWKQRFDL